MKTRAEALLQMLVDNRRELERLATETRQLRRHRTGFITSALDAGVSQRKAYRAAGLLDTEKTTTDWINCLDCQEDHEGITLCEAHRRGAKT